MFSFLFSNKKSATEKDIEKSATEKEIEKWIETYAPKEEKIQLKIDNTSPFAHLSREITNQKITKTKTDIVVNQTWLETLSKEQRKFVILHEIQHSRQDPLQTLDNCENVAITSILFPHQAIDRLSAFVYNKPYTIPPFWLTFLKQRILLPIVLTGFVYMGSNWYREFEADYVAFHQLEITEKSEAIQFFKKDKDQNFLNTTHPPYFLRYGVLNMMIKMKFYF